MTESELPEVLETEVGKGDGWLGTVLLSRRYRRPSVPVINWVGKD